MLRPTLALTLAAAALLASGSTSEAVDDPRFAADFVQGLREKGYYDLALEYLDLLRKDPSTPDDYRKAIEYEEGRTLIEAATHANDPDSSKEKLDQAKVKIEAFVRANPDAPETTGALVELAHLLYERGRAEVDLSGDARAPAEKENRLASARGYYASAREAYDRSFARLNEKLGAYPKFIPPENPKRLEREKVRGSLMQAELQRSVVDYEEAQTYPAAAKERSELLEKALASFDDIYKRYRNQMAGFNARMWQGKCFEEQGKLGEAMGIYNELIDHPDSALRVLQKQVDHFRIIVMAKRKEYALAADECNRWLAMFPKDRRSYDALGVQFELAKNIIAQLPNIDGERDRERATRTATENLAEVVRVVSPFKPEALALLQKYRPNVALRADDVARMSYDEAMASAEQANQLLEYDKAIALFKVAIRKADPLRDPVKANRARYFLAYCCYMTRRYYEAAVLAEYLARRYPAGEWSAKATVIGLSSLVDAYNAYPTGNRTGDLDRLVDLARYTAQTWPDTEQGDSARMAMGQVAIGRGQYPRAIEAFDSVRPSSSNWVDAQAFAGDAQWKQSVSLREKGKDKDADAAVARALEKFKAALKARKDANAPETDPAYVSNACDLAVIDLETGKGPEALALLEPIARKLAASKPAASPALASRVTAGILRAHIAAGKVDLAIGDMKALETIGGGAPTAQLYLGLGRLLEGEIEALKKRNDQAGLKRTEQAYQKFLNALVASKSGQTFQSLRWAADNLLKLGAAKEANDVYANIIKFYSADPEFARGPNAADAMLRVKVKQVAALRSIGDLSQAESNLNDLIEQNKRLLELQVEKGHLLDAKAEAKQGTWAQAYSYWKALAGKLAGMSPKPEDYYEAWYRAAVALDKQGKPDLARTTLANIMKLSRDMGGPEMKAKYQGLIKQLGK